MTFNDSVNYYGKLTSQFPLQPLRVVYAKAGMKAAAAVVRSARSVIDHKLYWMAPNDEAEARYLEAILNSETTRSRIEGLQSEGQFGPRDFDKVMFTLPIARFNASLALHQRIVGAALEAEQIAAAVSLDGLRGFQRIRKAIREALDESGVSSRIDGLVAELLDAEARGARRIRARP